jgi:hypothetical protein
MFDSQSNNALTYVKQGMDVYDMNNDKIGTVDYVRMGDENPNTPGTDTVTARNAPMRDDSLIEEVAEAIFDTDDFPQVLRNRMLRYGYIRIDTGLLRADCYAMGDQVMSVSDGRVDLSITADELVRP